MWCKSVGIVRLVAPLLFFEALANFTFCQSVEFVSECCFAITDNVLQLPEGGDFEAIHFRLSTNFDRCTKLDLTTEPPLLGRCCYGSFFLSFCYYFSCLWCNSNGRNRTAVKLQKVSFYSVTKYYSICRH